MMNWFFLALLATSAKVYPAQLVDCYDGDTCTFNIVVAEKDVSLGQNLMQHITITRKDQRVRLCDINAPEMKGDAKVAATKARDDLLSWIRNAKTIELRAAQKNICEEETCDSIEKYGRMLGWIYADGVNLNAKQVESGNAVPYIKCAGAP